MNVFSFLRLLSLIFFIILCYNKRYNIERGDFMEKLARLLNEQKAMKILDVGTGTGNFVSLITSCYNDFTELTGIDTTPGAVEAAKKNFTDDRISFEVMDGNHMVYDDNSFDVVCLSNSLHHLTDIEGLFKEMGRVLKPDGVIVVSEMIRNNLTKKQISHRKIHHFAAKTDRLQGVTHNDTFSDKELVEVLETRTEFKPVKTWTLNILRTNELPERFKWFEDTVQRLLAKVPENLVTPELIEEGQDVIKYIKENGFDSCPSLIVVIKK